MKAEERNGTTSKSQKLLSPFHKRITHLFTDISCERSTFFQFHGFTQAVSVSAILFLTYKIRADVLSSALIPLIR